MVDLVNNALTKLAERAVFRPAVALSDEPRVTTRRSFRDGDTREQQQRLVKVDEGKVALILPARSEALVIVAWMEDVGGAASEELTAAKNVDDVGVVIKAACRGENRMFPA